MVMGFDWRSSLLSLSEFGVSYEFNTKFVTRVWLLREVGRIGWPTGRSAARLLLRAPRVAIETSAALVIDGARESAETRPLSLVGCGRVATRQDGLIETKRRRRPR